MLIFAIGGSLTAHIYVKEASYSVFNLWLEARRCTAISALRDSGTHLINTGHPIRELLRAGFCFCTGCRHGHRNVTQLLLISTSAEL